jgi:hypothetical protein
VRKLLTHHKIPGTEIHTTYGKLLYWQLQQRLPSCNPKPSALVPLFTLHFNNILLVAHPLLPSAHQSLLRPQRLRPNHRNLTLPRLQSTLKMVHVNNLIQQSPLQGLLRRNPFHTIQHLPRTPQPTSLGTRHAGTTDGTRALVSGIPKASSVAIRMVLAITTSRPAPRQGPDIIERTGMSKS